MSFSAVAGYACSKGTAGGTAVNDGRHGRSRSLQDAKEAAYA